MKAKVRQKRNTLEELQRDANNLRKSPTLLLLGVKGAVSKNPENLLNCGACGYVGCAKFMSAEKKDGKDFVGSIRIFET